MSCNVSLMIKKLLEDNESPMSLDEIYKRIDYDFEGSKDYTAIIRRSIYNVCLDRDIRNVNLPILFFSIDPKGTKGNKYALIDWLDIKEGCNVSQNVIDEYVEEYTVHNPIYTEQNIMKFLRSKVTLMNALIIANHKCEFDSSHVSFYRRSNGEKYMEGHHLIPLKFQNDFNVSLDIEENIVSLCSNCHNEIHYGQFNERLIEKLYHEKVEKLSNRNIFISLDKLKEYYT